MLRTLRHKSNKPNSENEIKKFIVDYENLGWKELENIYGAAPRTLRDWASVFGAKKIKNNSYIVPDENCFSKDVTYDELIEYYKLHSKIRNKIENKNIGNALTAEIITDTPVALVFTSDWHLGGGVDIDTFDKDMKTIKDTPNVYCFLGGDLTSNIIQPSKMGTGINELPVESQKALLYRTIEMLLPKIVALGTGNHSYWSTLATGEDELAQLARRLKILYTGHGGLLTLRVGTINYKIFRVHKSKWSSQLNITHSAKQNWRLGEWDADLLCVEHRHNCGLEPFYGHGQEKYAIQTGTYSVFDDYAMRNGFFGMRPANPTIVLYPDRKKMVGFLHMDEAIEFLGKVK